MRLDQIAAQTMNLLLAPFLRRALAAAVFALFVLIALYHVTTAGTVALELRYGTLYAHLIVAGIYGTLALIAFAVLWAMRAKAVPGATPPALSEPRNMQLVALIEAAMLGYTMARKSDRTR